MDVDLAVDVDPEAEEEETLKVEIDDFLNCRHENGFCVNEMWIYIKLQVACVHLSQQWPVHMCCGYEYTQDLTERRSIQVHVSCRQYMNNCKTALGVQPVES